METTDHARRFGGIERLYGSGSLARLAVAKAVRLPAGGGEAEMRALVAQLFATASPLTSPSGRSAYIELNHSELARRFQK